MFAICQEDRFMTDTKSKGLNISAKSFITSILVILVLMILTYILTLILPGGSYLRSPDANGNLVIDTENGFSFADGGIPFWKWLLSPILVLGSSGSTTLIAVIAFLLVIGGIFNALDKSGLMKYMLDKITFRFRAVRYRLMAFIILFFMALGAMIGSFEECVPLVPIVLALAINFGWDTLTGMGMSLLAVGCGFATGVCNPFTVGVAQQLAGLPMFSGIWLRVLSFALIYLLLLTFIRKHAKKVEKCTTADDSASFTKDARMDKGVLCFALFLGFGIAAVLSSALIPALQDYTMIIVAVMFLVAGIVSCLISGMSAKAMGSTALSGVISILPAVAMIIMASSIKFTLEEAKVLDTILHEAVLLAEHLPKWAVILFIYFVVLVMNFFISSGSAKAFMLIPLIVPLAQIFGISTQLCIAAFAFGDGFSNVLYPTNPVLLISLGLADVSYGKWFKWSVKFQINNLILTSLLLLFGLWIGY